MQQPGTYTGADGRKYRWWHESHRTGMGRYFRTDTQTRERVAEIDDRDIDAAKAALDALVEAEEEWVEIGDWRVDREGTKAQFRFRVDGTTTYQWGERMGDGQAYSILGPYRKGREVALEESSALRDAARELVEAVLEATNVVMYDDKWPAYSIIRRERERRIRSLARVLEEKL